MKNIAILGSTGSIGRQTVDVALAHPELFTVSVLAANKSDELLETKRRRRGSRRGTAARRASKAAATPSSRRRHIRRRTSSSRA